MNTLSWLSRLIAFDTTSRNSNLELIHCIEDWLKQHQIVSQLIRDVSQPKANLFATLPAQNGATTGGIILSGHTDVVPVDGQDWESPPFAATERDGKIFGRGACDMKGFIAVVLALIPEFKKLSLSQPIHFAFSYDEEIGCLGAPHMIADIKKRGINANACIVGEPTDMRPVVAHKGKQSFRCSVHGIAAHSSLTTQGCNAIEHAADLICFIRRMTDEFNQNGPFDQFYDVPFTTLTTNLIKGGNAYNTIPSLCEFIFEFRNLPQDNPKLIRDKIKKYISEELLPKMKKENAEANIVLDTIGGAPGLEASEDALITQLARKISQEKATIKVAYATEAGMFQEADIPTILCGPGSIEQAHRANEYVTLEQLQKCEKFLSETIQSICC
jgi:acetylornithine deacetylase